MEPDFDCYDVLGVSRKSRHAEIVRAFRELSKANHPDRGGDPKTFDRIATAYRILGTRSRRDEYDSLNPEGVLFVPEFEMVKES
jgi:curved DNA-binding protein CbpA